RKIPSNRAPIPSRAVRDGSLSESVLNSTRRQPRVSKAWPSISSFASRFAPVRCQAGATHVQPISSRRCSGTMFMNRLLPIGRPVDASIVANGNSVPAARAASAVSAQARRSASLVGRAIVHCQIAGSRATSARRGTCSSASGSRWTRRPSSVTGSMRPMTFTAPMVDARLDSTPSPLASVDAPVRAPPPSEGRPVTEFAQRVDAFFAEYFAREPTDATAAGNHDYDGLWPDVSRAAEPDRLAFIDAWAATFGAFGDDVLDVDERVDRDLLLGVLSSYRFNEVELAEDAWSPMAWVYLIGQGFFG